ncbi:MAG: BolA family transcriptional regulator [Deltaproteobacteria bacterium]|nr:BolA family transcriptional regulator [Deltaproteobacteria bacterium]
MIEAHEVEAKIRAGVPDAQHVAVEDLTGTKDHYRAIVVSAAFAGKSRVQQHQLVYASLGALVGGDVHALALSTFTPEAWAAKQG